MLFLVNSKQIYSLVHINVVETLLFIAPLRVSRHGSLCEVTVGRAQTQKYGGVKSGTMEGI